MPRSRPREPASRAAASRWSRRRCARWRSAARVSAGSELVGKAGETMGEIVAQVTKVNDLVGEITAASDEQSRGIAQIGQAVSQLDQVTQQNAALVEESAAAADSMKAQAQKLSQTVAVFNVGAGGAIVVDRAAIAEQR